MKKSCVWYGLIAVVGVALILAIFIPISVGLRTNMLKVRVPPTVEELNALGAILKAAAAESVTLSAKEVTAAGDDDGEPEEAVPLPQELASAATLKMRERRFKAKRPGEIFKRKTTQVWMRALEGGLSLISKKYATDWSLERGHELMTLGRWDEARQCYWEALDSSLEPRYKKRACAQLAWLEGNPEMAARYLELSCEGEVISRLRNAIELCRATGSDELATYYLNRLQAVDSDQARHYDEDE